MFVQNLNPAQQAALLHLAKEIINADNQLADEETAMLAAALKEQTATDVTAQAITAAELPALFSSERAKCSLLLELLGFAHADSNYHPSERNLISQYAQALNIGSEKLAQMDNWVVQQLALMQQSENFFH
ncbi:TerB family tellurite resistance protein [Stenoxybacter acetivorans]|uniref:TerB family tellurite resistance protein n=1 Tax=Stenoxybacter acetivorans TaxID=422441 RepID=UPI00056BF6A5|nr:TerB family tellurite resistance protein [Stenoxybacter acetivorans]